MSFPDELKAPALELAGRELPPGFFDSAAILVTEVLDWNLRVRLVGHRSAEIAYPDLILDSLALLPHIKGPAVLDIGSGAGFPGLVLALAAPELRVTMIEGRAKKVSFQKHAASLLGLEGRAVPVVGRAGEGALSGEKFNTVTLRAVTDIPGCLKLARPYMAKGGVVVLPRSLSDEGQALDLGLQTHHYRLPGRETERIVAAGPLKQRTRRGTPAAFHVKQEKP